MSKIFQNQNYLRIRLTTSVDVTNALEKKIYYKKPDGVTGSVTATVEDASTGILYYDVPSTPALIDQSGNWKFWSFIKFSDGRTARGESIDLNVYSDVE